MGIGKVNSEGEENIAKVNTLAKLSINKINSVTSSFAAVFADNYAVSKSITTGLGNTIRALIPADSPISFLETDAFTISFWIKAGWTSSLNTTIFFVCMNPSGASSSWDNQIRLRYKEDNNRMVFRMLNNPGDSNFDIAAEWLFHSNSGIYAAGYAAAGLGTTYWSAANRGYVGDDDFTMITLVKTTSTAGSAVRLYWNANAAGAPPITGDSSPGSMAMNSDEERELLIGSSSQPWATNTYYRAGDGVATQYNDFAIWDVALDADAITAIYNSGTPIDLTSDSGNYDNSGDLQLYHEFENNGTANTNADLSGDSYDMTVSGDSGFESL